MKVLVAAHSIGSTSTVVQELRRPSRPGWIVTGWSVVVAALFTVIVFVPPAFALLLSGLVDDSGTGSRVPSGFVTWPYYPGGWWAVATDVAIAAVVIGVAAVATQRSLARRTGFHLSRVDAIVAVGLTGWWPLLGVHPLRVSAPLAFLVAVTIVRWRATTENVDERWPVVPLLAVASVAVAAIGLYVLFHPIRLGAGVGAASFGTGPPDHEIIQLHNAGFADVTLLGLSVPAGVGTPYGLRPAVSLGRIAGTKLRGRGFLWLTLKRAGCPPHVATLRYRLFGRTMSAPIVLRENCAPN